MHHFTVHRQRNSFVFSLVLLLLTFFAVTANARTAPLKAAAVPVIASVQVPVTGNYKKNDKLTFTVNFSSVVRITALSRIALTINGQTRYAINESNGDASVQKFSYVVGLGDDLSNGTVYFDNKLEIVSGLIRDVASGDYLDQGLVNLPVGTPVSITNTNVDGTPPVPGVFQLTGPKDVAVSVPALSFTISFSEKVANVTKAGWVATGTTKVTYSDYNVVMNPDQQTGLITFLNVTNLDHRDSGMLGVALIPGPSGITDLAGNPLEATGVSNSYYMEKAVLTAPVPTISVVGGKTKVNGPFTVKVVFDKTVLPATFDAAKLTVTNGTAVFTGNPAIGVYEYQVTPASTPQSGAITVKLQPGAIKGETNLDNVASNELILNYDLVRPVVQSIVPSTNNVLNQFEAIVTFSEPVSGLSATGLLGTNGAVTISELAPVNGTVYKITFVPVTPTADINYGVMENAAYDEYGNGNVASTIGTYHYDAEIPRPLSLVPATATPTNLNTGAFVLTFSEEVTAPLITDFVTATTGSVAGATVSAVVRLTPASFRIDLTGITGDGDLNLSLLGTANVRDNYNNKIGTGISSSYITYDHTSPQITLPAGGGAYGAPFTITYSFNEAVVPGDPAAFSFTNATQGALTKVDDTHYSTLVSPGVTGNFSVTVHQNAFYDKAGNPLAAAATFQALYNNDIPQPELTRVPGYTSPFTVNVHFSIPVTTPITVTGFAGTNLQALTLQPQAGTNNQDYTLLVTPFAAGPVSVYLNAAVTQSSTGIPSAISNTLTWTYDDADFNVVLTGPLVAVNSFVADVVSNKDIDPLTADKFDIANGTITNIQKISNTQYKLTVTAASTGIVTVQMPAGAYFDAVGRPNTASNSLAVDVSVNLAPTDITLSKSNVDENSVTGTVVGILGGVDPNAGNTFTFDVIGGPDMASFEVNGAGELVTKAVFDYETKNEYRITIKITDNYGAWFAKDFVITVNDVNEAPTDILLNNTNVDENKPVGTAIANVTGMDPENNSLIFTLVNTADAAMFTIGADKILRTAAVFDYETKSTYTIRIKAEDPGGLSFEKDFTIHVQNVNESPASISLNNNTVDENKPAGTLVGTFTVQDPDNFTFDMELVPGGDADKFELDGYELKTAASFDYEVKNQYNIRVRAVDGEGLDVEKDFVIYVNNINEQPVDLTISNSTVGDNAAINTTVGTLSTTDQDAGDTFTYSLAAGGDNDAFLVSGNTLLTKQTFDVTVKTSYTISVTTTDAGGLSFTKQLTITIVHVPLAPTDISLSANTINENQPVNTEIGTFTTVDANAHEAFTYTLLPGLDADSFNIVNDKLYNKVVFNYEKGHTYSIKVQVKDVDGLTFEKVFTITVADVNEAPVLALSNTTVDDFSPAGTIIGNLTVTDEDANETQALTFDGGADDAKFEMVGGQLSIKTVVDYLAKSSYEVKIKVTDKGGLTDSKTFIITVNRVNKVPTDIQLSSNTVNENLPAGTLVGTLTATDANADDTHTFSIEPGGDAAAFTVVGNELRTNAAFDFETKNSYAITIKVTDAGSATFTKSFTIQVNNVNEAPDVNLSKTAVDDYSPVGTVVANIITSDPENDAVTLAFAGGADDSRFTIANNVLSMAAVVNAATQSSYTIKIRATDSHGKDTVKTFVITVTIVNPAPTAIQLSNNTIEENKPAGTVVGTLTATDAGNDTHTFTILPGGDAASFTIQGNELRSSAVFDYEVKQAYTLRIRVTDAGNNTYEKDFTVTVTNVNDAPTAISLSGNTVMENVAAGATVGTLTGTDQDAGDILTFSLAGGADDAAFEISGTTLKTKIVFDYETKRQYNIKIKVTDAGGLSYTQDFVIGVTNVNEPPTDFQLDNNTLPELKPVGTVVGNLTATDPDANETFTWTLVGGADQAKFKVTGNQVVVNGVLDYMQQKSYTIRIRVTDAGGLWIEKDVTITVTSTNSAPTNISLDKNSILENAPAGTVIGTLSATDPDAGDVFTYAFAGGADDAKFKINAGNQLISDAVFDYEQKNSYSVRVRVTDKRGLTFEKDLVIAVTDVNEVPTINAVTKQVVCDGHQAQEIRLTGLSAGPETGQTITLVATSTQDFFTSLTTRDNKDGTGAVRFTLKDNTKGSTTITVLVRDNGGVANGGVDQVAITFELLVNELPDVKVVSDKPNPVPAGSIVKLTASGGVSYEWGDGAYIIDGRNMPVLTLKPEATSVYLVTVTNENGCTVTTDFKVEVSGEVQVEAANLLTPNSDGINDRWMVKNIGRYLNNEVKIFDRAGRLVYTRKGYNNEWDGKLNGQLLAEGTYYYILDLGNGTRMKGFITIVREH
ncbi:gliding motility-associated C-terminal domain-containing protein [Chitinophaga jiangningensis]|uniref:Gliding motility-associated C-terminal domain-containing protein n=1 Tax=Chitinophaga jiangningensis TaxID=1419482 RepID=A0A1M6WPN1_9BACT|nr:cadherin domain-containing protein [Chitinophaga jiangningensis]SHK95485.1 gliding motility-associated C-terminal domain-containing protein [Chitinophaga jiangningensis]